MIDWSLALRPAKITEYKLIKTFFEQGRLFQHSLGFVQWLEGYPSQLLYEKDVESGRGYIIESGKTPIGYVVIDFNGDDEYDRLSHIWKIDGHYVVVHRFVLCNEFRGKGLSSLILSMIESYVASQDVRIIRFDTGISNMPMQALLKAGGYTNLGKYNFVWGERVAYEKCLK